MAIGCMACGEGKFNVHVNDLITAKVISFVCPACGMITAVSERPGGGLLVSLDAHMMQEQKKAAALMAERNTAST